MDAWGWIAVYAVGLTVLQLLVYRYLLSNRSSVTRRVGTPFGDSDGDSSASNHGPGTNRQSSGGGRGTDGSASNRTPPGALDAWPRATEQTGNQSPSRGSGHADVAHTDGRTCPHCGVTNEADETFSRCWNCARGL